MDKYLNGFANELAEYETPFSDIPTSREAFSETRSPERFTLQFESPFTSTFEAIQGPSSSPIAAEYVQLLSELYDTEFSNALYELANELEDSWGGKISNESSMGSQYLPFVTQQANEYFLPLAVQTETMIDKVSQQFSGNNFADMNEAEIEKFFSELEFNHAQFHPAQEQFFDKIFDKVKSVVKTGVNLAKKGVSAIGKILPINFILDKLKGLIRPLLDKVLRFAIGKLPKNLQPFAQSLAKRFLSLETSEEVTPFQNEIPTTSELDAVQAEFDNHIAQLVFSGSNAEADQLLMEYESSSDLAQRNATNELNGLTVPTLQDARENFINELKNLRPGESAAPAIERFLPAAIMALQPVIKMAISMIGRDRIIDFLAGLLAQLVGKYVPQEVAKPLASKIIDIGMSAIGFETFEANKADLAYEAIANTIEQTVQNLGSVDEKVMNNPEMLTAQLLEAFEQAAANNFPAEYLRQDLRASTKQGVWVLKPRNGPRHMYKKYTKVFSISIDPQTAKTVLSFRGVPLANFLRDKYGLDPAKPVQAKVHLYEAIDGTRLSMIAKHEKIPGLGTGQHKAWVQFHPLTKEAAALLLKEPGLGKDFSATFTGKRPHIAVGQQFYYLELNGVRLRVPSVDRNSHKHKAGGHSTHSMPGQSSDVQAIINFVRSEIRFNYYFSEEEATSVVEKLNKNDFLGCAISIRQSVKNVLNNILANNVGDKVRIIHEAVPELYLNNYAEPQENFSFQDVGNIAAGAGKELIRGIIEKLIDKLSGVAYVAVVDYFKARAAEFKQAQAEPNDGVTIKLIWSNMQGLSSLRAIINAVRGNLSLGNLSGFSLPNIPPPDVKISAGKNFD
jgi:hypothetical protein